MIDDELKRIGLTGYEASIYIALLKHGSSAAKAIADASGVPQTAVYPNLNSLVSKGLAQKIEGNEIAVFEAILPSIGFKAFIERKEDDLRERGISIARQLEQIKGEGLTLQKKDIVNLSFGLQASANITSKFMGEAEKSLYVFGWGFRSRNKVHSIFRDIRGLLRRKVDVRIILTPTEATLRDLVPSFRKAGAKLRFLPWGNFSIIVADSRECKITLKNKDLPERLNIHVQDKDLAKAMNDYFLNLWAKSSRNP